MCRLCFPAYRYAPRTVRHEEEDDEEDDEQAEEVFQVAPPTKAIPKLKKKAAPRRRDEAEEDDGDDDDAGDVAPPRQRTMSIVISEADDIAERKPQTWVSDDVSKEAKAAADRAAAYAEGHAAAMALAQQQHAEAQAKARPASPVIRDDVRLSPPTERKIPHTARPGSAGRARTPEEEAARACVVCCIAPPMRCLRASQSWCVCVCACVYA